MLARIPSEWPIVGMSSDIKLPSFLQGLFEYPGVMEELRPNEEETAFRFFTGVIFWLDIITCISVGKAPRLLHLHDLCLGPDKSWIQLQNIMGCENWVMVLIGRIAVLHEWKTRAKQNGSLDPLTSASLVEQGNNIQKDLEAGIDDNLERLRQVDMEAERIGNESFPESPDPSSQITRIFSLAATIYLHVTNFGAQYELDEIKTSVSDTISAIKALISTSRDLLRCIIWPIFVTGCMAGKKDEEFFRHLLRSPALVESGLRRRCKLIQLLEERWATRTEDSSSWSWEDSFKCVGFQFPMV